MIRLFQPPLQGTSIAAKQVGANGDGVSECGDAANPLLMRQRTEGTAVQLLVHGVLPWQKQVPPAHLHVLANAMQVPARRAASGRVKRHEVLCQDAEALLQHGSFRIRGTVAEQEGTLTLAGGVGSTSMSSPTLSTSSRHVHIILRVALGVAVTSLCFFFRLFPFSCLLFLLPFGLPATSGAPCRAGTRTCGTPP
jgi:hypothetical protein